MNQIFDYENASELNPQLYKIISKYKGKPVVGGGCKTSIHLHHEGIEELTTLLGWIGGLVPLVSHRYSNPNNDKFMIAAFPSNESKIFDYISGDDVILEKEPLEEVAKRGELRAFLHKGFWQCMDTRRDKEFLEEMWKMDRPPWIL